MESRPISLELALLRFTIELSTIVKQNDLKSAEENRHIWIGFRRIPVCWLELKFKAHLRNSKVYDTLYGLKAWQASIGSIENNSSLRVKTLCSLLSIDVFAICNVLSITAYAWCLNSMLFALLNVMRGLCNSTYIQVNSSASCRKFNYYLKIRRRIYLNCSDIVHGERRLTMQCFNSSLLHVTIRSPNAGNITHWPRLYQYQYQWVYAFNMNFQGYRINPVTLVNQPQVNRNFSHKYTCKTS